MFDKINLQQWLWYASQYMIDDKEKFELLRDVAEHNASFWNPEGVSQVRKAREEAFIVGDKDFARQIEETFGRKLSIPENKAPIALPIPAPEQSRRKMRKDLDPGDYLNTKLDEIRFVPIGR